MTLLDELKAIEPGYSGMNCWTVEEEMPEGAQLVKDDYTGSGRWSEHWTAIFKRGDEYVALDYERAATEYQEGGDFSHEFYSVKPRTELVEVTHYDKVN